MLINDYVAFASRFGDGLHLKRRPIKESSKKRNVKKRRKRKIVKMSRSRNR